MAAAAKSQLDPKQWVDLYSDYLFNYAVVRVNDLELAQDLVQDTFLSALKAQSGFRGESSEKTWLIIILKRKIIDHYRKKATQGIKESIELNTIASGYDHYFEQDGNAEGHWTVENSPHAWSTDSSARIESKEFYQVLNKCLSLLPGKWAAAFNLKNLEDVSAEDICKELNITTSNYWVIMHRSKLQLRECIEKNWNLIPDPSPREKGVKKSLVEGLYEKK